MAELILYRSFAPVDLDDDGRTVVGLAAPYNEVCLADDDCGPYRPYRETIDPGAFRSIVERWPARRCKVQLEHPERAGMGAWVGRGQEWRDEPEGLRVVLRLDDTEAGRVAAFKIRDGQTPAMSVAFVPGVSDTRWHAELGADVVHRQSVRAITHVALVPAGAYPGAQVEALRSGPDGDRPPSTVDGDEGGSPTPARDALQAFLATLAAGSPPPAGPPPTT